MLPWLTQGGLMGLLGFLGYRLHRSAILALRDAIATERERANDHKEAAGTWREVAREREEQLYILLGRRDPPS